MAINIEIKARVRDPKQIYQLAERLSDAPVQVIQQRDVFFGTDRGRLKLRMFSSDRGYLVYYERANVSGPRPSRYYLYETAEPASLERLLTEAFGVRGYVLKVRTLFLVGNTRIHLDDVEGLGHFVELEVVLSDDQTEADGQAIAENMMRQLGIRQEDLVDLAYMDLLELCVADGTLGTDQRKSDTRDLEEGE